MYSDPAPENMHPPPSPYPKCDKKHKKTIKNIQNIKKKPSECGIEGLASKEGLWIARNGREEEEEKVGKETEDTLRMPTTSRFAVRKFSLSQKRGLNYCIHADRTPHCGLQIGYVF